MTDSRNNDVPSLAIDMGVLGFSGNTLNGVTTTNYFRFGSVGAEFTTPISSDEVDFYRFTPYRMDTVKVAFDADSVGDFVSAMAIVPISGVSRVVGDALGVWHGGEHARDSDPKSPGFDPTFTRDFYGDTVRSGLGDLFDSTIRIAGNNYDTNVDFSSATLATDPFPDAEAIWYLTGAPVIFAVYGAQSNGTDGELSRLEFTQAVEEVDYDFDIFPNIGQPDPPISFEDLFVANPTIANGLAASYETLIGGVPNKNGFMDLINLAISTNFGSGVGPVFNQENIFINLVNNLVSGNSNALSAFNDIASGSTNVAKITSIYREIVPTQFQTDEGLDFLTRSEGISFYQAAAAERGITGSDGVAIIALASLLNIAVNSDFGVGNGVNDLFRAVGNGSENLPTSANRFTALETADGTQFDSDDGARALYARNMPTVEETPDLVGVTVPVADVF